MANSLRAKLSKLRHDGNITDAEYQELIKKLDGHDMEIYALGYNQGTIDRAEELQKCREYGYNKAIDEFAERLQEKVESFQTEINGFKADVLTLDYFVEFVDEIAEQLKGGAE